MGGRTMAMPQRFADPSRLLTGKTCYWLRALTRSQCCHGRGEIRFEFLPAHLVAGLHHAAIEAGQNRDIHISRNVARFLSLDQALLDPRNVGAAAAFVVIGIADLPMNPAMVARVMRAVPAGPLVNTVHVSILHIGLAIVGLLSLAPRAARQFEPIKR